MMPFLVLLLAPLAQAFCGFYVSGADTTLYNDATMVVMMRSGTKTVLSMQNSYQGPPEAFALVVPVPEVLQKKNVKTLPREIFNRVDTLASPRLVAYWEKDPCAPDPPVQMMRAMSYVEDDGGSVKNKFGVKVEAQFQVGEYDIVILSASDSGGLDKWLRKENYNIPKGADEALAPYVAAGTKFFVAKVDPERVTFEGDRAVLSPLRVHFDSETFSLPVRLGLLNAKGPQDLIVHLLAPGQRYEVANYDNAFIPTNLRVSDKVKEDFGGFYEALFSEVARPRTVVTEYSWDATSCDPCPEPALTQVELATLGADVLESGRPQSYVLTRLHYRYEADGLDADLVFRAAPPVVGGRGMPQPDGTLAEQGAKESGRNAFQGRYVMLYPWEAEVTCENPRRGRWGGPPNGGEEVPVARSPLATGGVSQATPSLTSLVVDPLPKRKGQAKKSAAEPPPKAEDVPAAGADPSQPGGRGCSTLGSAGLAGGLVLCVLVLARRSKGPPLG